jgi:ABC-type phosphate transport system permease subunit
MTTPLLIVAIVVYLFIGNVKEYFNRMFFASVVATICGATHLIIWEFSTNPMVEATEIFGSISIILVVVLMSVLIWCVRKSIRE